MTDGVRLATDVFRLQDGRRRRCCWSAPPTGKDQMTVGGSDSFDILRAVQAGCVVVTQDVRGRYSSDGEFEPNVNETSDGVDTIAWAAAQPWAAGVVGTFGGSYLGGTQWLPARQSPPALKAMAPSVTFSDMHEGCCFAESRPIRFNGLAIRGIGVSNLPLDQGADRYHAVDGAAPSSCCTAPNRVFRWEGATTCTQAPAAVALASGASGR